LRMLAGEKEVSVDRSARPEKATLPDGRFSDYLLSGDRGAGRARGRTTRSSSRRRTGRRRAWMRSGARSRRGASGLGLRAASVRRLSVGGRKRTRALATGAKTSREPPRNRADARRSQLAFWSPHDRWSWRLWGKKKGRTLAFFAGKTRARSRRRDRADGDRS